MSRNLYDKARKRLAAESGPRARPWGGRLSVALVYPNTYRNAMSNLGFQTVCQLLNSRDDALCERFFLPDGEGLAEHRRTGTPLFSLDSGKALGDFDLIAFSISFENDYLNLPVIFELGGMPWLAAERSDRFPLLLCGGVCAFMNPEPLARVMDLFAVGEAEAILPGLIAALGRGESSLPELAQLPGIYAPSLYTERCAADGKPAGWETDVGAPLPVRRVWQEHLDDSASRTFIFTGDTEFGDMALTEISRGCSRGCRFCAAGYLFLPPRERSLDNLLRQIDAGLCARSKQGLVSPAVGDYPRLSELQAGILERGGTVSVASIRMDTITAADVEALHRSGHRTVSLAPEAGSQEQRDAINKGVSEEQILNAVRLLAEGGIPNLKLYFLIGLPGESQEDVRAIAALTGMIREVWIASGRQRGRLGSLHLSVNPFVPKPFTPFQWAPMATEAQLKRSVRLLRGTVGRMANVTVSFESPRAALLQGLLSRGGRELGGVIPRLAEGIRYPIACREAGIDADAILHRARDRDDPLPWEVVDSGVRREYLWQEYRLALAGKTSPRCVAGCVRCGVC